MTEAQQTEEMKRYLFYEMSAEESDALEERYFEDTGFFYDLLELENDLIDRYAVGKLQGEDLVRFEKSLEKSPERREKIADARVLQKLIVEEKSKREIVVAAAPTFWEKLSSFFKISTSGLKLAAGAFAVLLVCATVFLIYQNRQNDLAERKRREAERIEKEQIAQSEQNQTEKSNNRQPDNSNINAQPNNNNQNTEEKNLKELPKKDIEEKKTDIPSANRDEVKPSKPILAVFIGRVRSGTSGTFEPTAKIDTINGEQKIILTVPIPTDKNYESIEIVSETVRKKTDISEGAKSVVFDLPPRTMLIEIRATERDASGSWKSLGIFELEVNEIKK